MRRLILMPMTDIRGFGRTLGGATLWCMAPAFTLHALRDDLALVRQALLARPVVDVPVGRRPVARRRLRSPSSLSAGSLTPLDPRGFKGVLTAMARRQSRSLHRMLVLKRGFPWPGSR